MAITSARRRGRAVPAASLAPEPASLPAEPLPIGLPDLNVTSCPICARPIAVGTGKCPGCGTRLLLGVPAKRGGAFVGIGLVIGLIVGAGAASVAGAFAGREGGSRPGGAPGVPSATASVAPGASGGVSAVPSAAPTTSVPSAPVAPSGAPGQATAALAQVLVVNDRLAARSAELRAELDAKPFDSFAVATTLRALAADAVVGSGVTPLVGAWSSGAPLAARLHDYYARVGSTATGTLAASLSDPSAYRDGASAMLGVLADLVGLDRDSEALATAAGVAIPQPSTAAP